MISIGCFTVWKNISYIHMLLMNCEPLLNVQQVVGIFTQTQIDSTEAWIGFFFRLCPPLSSTVAEWNWQQRRIKVSFYFPIRTRDWFKWLFCWFEFSTQCINPNNYFTIWNISFGAKAQRWYEAKLCVKVYFEYCGGCLKRDLCKNWTISSTIVNWINKYSYWQAEIFVCTWTEDVNVIKSIGICEKGNWWHQKTINEMCKSDAIETER